MQKITPCLWFDCKDPAGAQRAVQAMLQMTELDINKLRKAYEQA